MLFEREKNLKEQYYYLNDEDKEEFVMEKFFNRNHLKVYGSLLVLYRLAAKYTSTKELIDNRKYRFWLVASEMDTEQMRASDNLAHGLQERLQSTLKSELLIDVKILPARELENMLKPETHP